MTMWMWANSPRTIDQDSLDQIVHDCHLLDVTDILFLAYDEYSGSGLLFDSDLFHVSSARVEKQLVGDYLIAAAHAAGLRVHLWWPVACWGGMYTHLKQAMPSGWDCANSIGASHWLDMSQVAARVFLGQVAADLVTSNLNADGLHLDYIRYETRMAKDHAEIGADDVTAAVQAIRDGVGAGVTLTVAGVPYRDGYPGYNFDVAGCSQDWPAWLRAGLVDAVQVMNYYDAADLDVQLAQYTELADIVGNIADGISPMDWAEPMSAESWAALLAAHQKYNLDLALFDHAQMTTERKLTVVGDDGRCTFRKVGSRSGEVIVDGQVVEIGETPEQIRRAIEAGAGKFAGNLHLHINRDGTVAIATGREPAIWPEDIQDVP